MVLKDDQICGKTILIIGKSDSPKNIRCANYIVSKDGIVTSSLPEWTRSSTDYTIVGYQDFEESIYDSHVLWLSEKLGIPTVVITIPRDFEPIADTLVNKDTKWSKIKRFFSLSKEENS